MMFEMTDLGINGNDRNICEVKIDECENYEEEEAVDRETRR